MKFELAQLNIATFRLPAEHPVNKDFIDNLDHVNSVAESAPGFIWRLVDDDATLVTNFSDPNTIVNLSVWNDIPSLVKFVYHNQDHRDIMRRRKEWFDNLEFHMVLWWVEAGQRPTTEDAKLRLDLLRTQGPSYAAFTFKHAFAAPTGEREDPFKSS